MKFMIKFECSPPSTSETSFVMPILKPKTRNLDHVWDHNDFRKLTIMTVWRKFHSRRLVVRR